MSTFDFYIHGTPKGHEIWGSEKNHKYIEKFYGHDSLLGGNVTLNIDICAGISYYTYIRQENVYDVGGRPGAFFALTVGFPNFYCTNVYKLYQLFDAIYKQLCADSIIQISSNGDRYLVSEFQTAQKQGQSTVKKIEAAFSQKEKEVIEPYLKPLDDYLNTFTHPKRVVSLLDVDSPIFFDLFKKYSLIVSPSIQSSVVECQRVTQELESINSQKIALTDAYTQLQRNLEEIRELNVNLSQQLENASVSVTKKYQATVEDLRSKVQTANTERDELKKKIAEATSSIELMDQPFQKLSRLLAGRFQEIPTQRSTSINQKNKRVYGENDSEYEPSSVPKNKKTVQVEWINTILLSLLLFIAGLTLYFIIFPRISNNSTVIKEKIPLPTEIDNTNISDKFEEITYNREENHDNFIGKIDIRGQTPPLKKNISYTLQLLKSTSNAGGGSFQVNIIDGPSIEVNNNSFIITDNDIEGYNDTLVKVKIIYTTINNDSVERIVDLKI